MVQSLLSWSTEVTCRLPVNIINEMQKKIKYALSLITSLFAYCRQCVEQRGNEGYGGSGENCGNESS